jgi:hypothetical protein
MAIVSNSNCKPCCSKKGTRSKAKKGSKKVVPYEEMERLMNVYGALKAVRNRGAKPSKNDGEGDGSSQVVKRDSIKRKFYRWFPDLEERFYRTEKDQYLPIHGHEQEVKYRKEMREKSSESVTKKRARANQKTKYLKMVRGELPRGDQPLPELVGGARGALVIPPPPSRQVTFEAEDIISSLVSEDEDESSTIDNTFYASGSIFDEVNKEFYGEEESSSRSLDIVSSALNSSSWDVDLELFGDDLLNILEEESV